MSKGFHHYRKDLIVDRVSKLERYIIDMLLNSDVTDAQRESSIAFEMKHHSNAAQFARLLARKRKLPIDICTAGALLHDISVIETGKYANHAHNGVGIAERILDELGGWTADEKEKICKIVRNHSDKHVWSTDPLEEFGKDVDILDCFLYPNAIDDYKINKTHEIYRAYLKRAKLVFAELGVDFNERV